jgi:hypothetical protein
MNKLSQKNKKDDSMTDLKITGGKRPFSLKDESSNFEGESTLNFEGG